MDKVIYIAMTGARELLWRQATVANSLANVNTNGFRAEVTSLRALPYIGDGANTRAMVVENSIASDLTPGSITQTGRELDVAIQGPGWIAVQDAQGREAYTRAGSLQINSNGLLQTRNGLNVLGDAGGPLTIPPDEDVLIARDGTISSAPVTGDRNAITVVGRMKLVNPPEADLVRGDDGLFRTRNGGPAPADINVALLGAALENSNVNPADALVSMITLARQFDMQIKLLQNAEANANSAEKLLAVAA
jgi:flagellar basal-body rod protein FlgF